jgi:hypothetical protein
VALVVVPGVVGAAPIQPASCADGPEFYECDIYADYDGGPSLLGLLDGNLGGYLPAYSLLLTTAANLADGLDASEVAHILVVQDDLFSLYSNIPTLQFDFGAIFTEAFAFAASPPALSQILGCPIAGGVLQFEGVGYCTTADVVTLFPVWDGGNDILRIHTALSGTQPPPPGVPEPSAAALFALAAAAIAVRRRRNRGGLLQRPGS